MTSPTSNLCRRVSVLMGSKGVMGVTPSVSYTSSTTTARGRRVVSTSKVVIKPKLVSARIRFHSPNFACGRSVRANSLTTTGNNFAAIMYVTGAGPAISGISALGSGLAHKGRRGVHVCRTTTVSRSLGKRSSISVTTLGRTKTYNFASSNVPLAGTTFYCETVRGTTGLSVPVDLRRRSPTFVGGGNVGRKGVSSTLNVCNSPSVTRRTLITESYLLTLRDNTSIIVRRVDSNMSISVIHVCGGLNTELRTRTAPRRFALARSTILRRNALTGVGPPLHARTSHRGVVRKLVSNAVSLVTASRTPRDARRGSGPMARTPDNVVNLRASLTLNVADLIGPNRLDVLRLLRGVAVGPTELCRVPCNAVSRNTTTSFIVFSPSRG